MPDADEDHKLNFARRWINSHVDLCTSTLHKPLVLAEFGKKPSGKIRAAFYDKVQLSNMHATNEAIACMFSWLTLQVVTGAAA